MTCPSCRTQNDRTVEVCSSCGRRLGATLGPGSLVADRYEILSQIGVGGMGTVFKARDRTLELEVALKVVRGGSIERDSDLADRFRREVKLAWKVRHRNVCGIHEYGEDGTLLYISMDLVEGLDVKHLLRERGTPAWEEAYDIVLQAAEGLQAIHDAGVIHRDLKTANIMRDDHGLVRVMDFGIAKVRDESSGLTGTGQVVGSPEYMSPEQVRGRQLDFRSDIYAFGVVIYEVFTGRVPFRADTPVHTMLRHLETLPPLEGPEAAQIPAALVPVLRTALAKLPEERYSSCREMLAALQEARAALAAQDTDSLTHGASPANTGNTPTRVVRREAASGTSGLRASQARLLVPPLLKGLRHADKDVRARSAQALGRMGPPAQTARESLVAALEDPDPEVRREAAVALDAIGPNARAEVPAPSEAAFASGSEARPSSTNGAIPEVRAEAAHAESQPLPVPAPPDPATDETRDGSAAPTPFAPGRVWPREDVVPAITPFRGTRSESAASEHPRGRAGPAPPEPRSTPRRGRPWVVRPWALAATALALAVGIYVFGRRPGADNRGVESHPVTTAPPPSPVSTPEGTDLAPPVEEPPPPATTAPSVPSPEPPILRPVRPSPRVPSTLGVPPTLVPQPLPTPFEPPTPEPTPLALASPSPTPTASPSPAPVPAELPPPPLLAPECQSCPAIPYPDLAFRLGTDGMVTVRIEVDATGRITSAEATTVTVTRGSKQGANSLEEAAVKGILNSWRFKPATQGGVPVKATITRQVRFIHR